MREAVEVQHCQQQPFHVLKLRLFGFRHCQRLAYEIYMLKIGLPQDRIPQVKIKGDEQIFLVTVHIMDISGITRDDVALAEVRALESVVNGHRTLEAVYDFHKPLMMVRGFFCYRINRYSDRRSLDKLRCNIEFHQPGLRSI